MASWNARHREPLLDRNAQDLLRQRGLEMLGIALVVAGVALAMILGSYSPDDPGWMAVTDAPVNNALGRFGATLASPLMIIAGMGAWGLVLGCVGWGLRFMLHRGEDRFLARAIYVPIAVALSSVWAATLVPGAGWEHVFGMGGVFGDTVLGALVTALPMAPGAAVNLLTVALGLALLLAWGYVLGVVRPEARAFLRFLLLGLVLSYSALRTVLRGGTRGGAKLGAAAAQGMAGRVMSGASELRARMSAPRRAPLAYAQDDGDHDPADAPYHDHDPRWHPQLPREPVLTAAAQRSVEPVLRAEPRHAPAHEDPGHSASRVRRAPEPAPLPQAEDPLFDDDHEADGWSAPYATAQPARMQPGATDHRAKPHVEAPSPIPATGPGPTATEDTAPGILSRLKRLSQRPAEEAPAHELVEQPPSPGALAAQAPEDDRIRARIADAIKARSRQAQALQASRREPLVARPRAEPALRATPAPAQSARSPWQQQPATQQNPQPMPRAMPTTTPAAPQPPAPPQQPAPVSQTPAPTPEPLTAAVSPTTISVGSWLDALLPFGQSAPPQPAPQPTPAIPDTHHVEADGTDTATPLVAEPLFDPEAPTTPTRPGQVFQRRVLPSGGRKPIAPSSRAVAEAQPALAFDPEAPEYELPPLSLLTNPDEIQRYSLSDDALEENARMLENVLDDYGIRGEIVSVRPGPVVTMYELEPAPGLKASRVIGLADDIARSMSALSARVSTVPGRSVIGIELPNAHREKVVLREILAARDFGDSQMRLPLALGKDIGGGAVVANLAKMPHLLIAGTTGSGKSVAINTMILSLLYKLTPDECRLIMIDPKMLELSVYDGIPHLLSPVVTDPKKAVVALKWVVAEMEDRYRKMSKMGVRNIEGYNGRVREALDRGEMFKRTVQTGFDDETGDPVFESEEFAPEALPYIVVIVDEMADLMMVAGKEIEACIQRLAQMARASGIHLIMATQRPSVDVITGTIKANFPTRISFQVTSKIDSRTILGEQGAEQLLGMGDMLYMAGGSRITRVHGPFVSDEEVEEIVNHLKSFGPPDYVGGVVEGPDSEKEADIDAVLGLGGNTDGEDALYDQAVQVVIKDRKCSTSYIQRKLGIGYNKAARLVEQMEDEGLVTPANHVGKREILVPEQG
ncbi:DNA translocase FtsK 4TM domain-containing protein [Rhodobacteraceae bacterium 2376]|uniref:DNA translocase FtsK n=1 Tax=Rhabdonatronobacter sediminivivens TaxID=2743469 RepID=A0A7Z0HYK2_9RHOB|nr:DNA translocase FtsK [Rhabdonatronobacter sediminivivens]NYS24642.1 DNA translocase FtsK 4TM domain-containing protein [Rhabdonatronobacter sediminivivens]